MGKNTSKASSTKATTKTTTTKTNGRPKVPIAKAGYTPTRRRYGNGGTW